MSDNDSNIEYDSADDTTSYDSDGDPIEYYDIYSDSEDCCDCDYDEICDCDCHN